jgi:hypothetical protein
MLFSLTLFTKWVRSIQDTAAQSTSIRPCKKLPNCAIADRTACTFQWTAGLASRMPAFYSKRVPMCWWWVANCLQLASTSDSSFATCKPVRRNDRNINDRGRRARHFEMREKHGCDDRGQESIDVYNMYVGVNRLMREREREIVSTEETEKHVAMRENR